MTTLTLKNYQAHESTVLEFNSGFIAVVGPTNSGKSSIVRGLKWCLYDSIRGKRFIRHGQIEASVKIDFGDASVERIKGTVKNVYKANSLTLESIGTGTPPEVVKVSSVPIINIDKDLDLELNVSMQHDAPFLLMVSDSAKSKFLNVLTGNHIFDSAIRNTKGKIKSIEDAQRLAESTVETVSRQLEDFKDLEAQERKIAEIEGQLARYEIVNQTIRSLTEIQTAQSRLRGEMLEAKDKLGKFDFSISTVSPLVDRLSSLELILAVLNEYQSVSFNLNTLRQEVTKVDQVILVVSPQVERMQAIEVALVQVKNASILNLDLDCLRREVNLLDADIERVRSELLSQPDSICGECGQIVTRKAREALV